MVTTILMDEEAIFTLSEVSDHYEIEREVLFEMIEQGLFLPVKAPSGEEAIDTQSLKKIQMALRLQNDLEINLSGVALVLELLEELKSMRNEVDLFHKHLSYK